MHIILFGGSFDPVHHGHLEIAKNALKQRNADEVWFIPTRRSPFKSNGSSYADRVHMLQLMIHGYRSMRVEAIEQDLPEPSYSIDTVKALQSRYPNATFEWLIGSDQCDRMHEWKDYDVLKTLVNFVVYKRDDSLISKDFITIEGTTIPTSSTAIRKGLSFDTKPSVLRYMMEQSLYTDAMLQARLTEYRYEHVKRVCDLACELARIHHIDEKRVRCAALMHDFCKEDSKESLISKMKATAPEHLSLHPSFYHAYAASDTLSRLYYVKDKHVLRAVRHHVDGKASNPIAMIVYIADKCEPHRSYDMSADLALCKKDLRVGFKHIKNKQREYLKKK